MKKGPQSVQNIQHEFHSNVQAMTLTGDAASYYRDGGTSIQSAPRDSIDLEYLTIEVPA